MATKKALAIFVYLLCTLTAIAAVSCDNKSTYGPSDQAGKTLGFSGEDYAHSIVQTSDGGYFITGYTNSIRDNYDLYAVKTDKKFNIQWSKTFGNINIDKGYKGKETLDGGFVILGTVYIGPANNDILCIKTDRRGKMLWSRHFGGTKNEEGRSFVELPDGGLVIAGSTESYGSGENDIILIKVDAQGRLKWTKTYGGASTDRAFDIHLTTDGGLAVTGRTSSYGGVYATYLLKTDAEGNQLWFTTSGGSQDEAQSVVQTAEGGFLTIGRMYVGLGNYQIYMIRYDGSGNTEAAYLLGFTSYEEAYSITPSHDGNYIVTGETLLENSTSDFQTLIFKVTSYGNVLWVRSYGGEKDDIGYSVQPTDNGYIVAGYTLSYGAGKSDIYVLNIDEDGELQ